MKLETLGRRIAVVCCALGTSAAILYLALAWPSMQGT